MRDHASGQCSASWLGMAARSPGGAPALVTLRATMARVPRSLVALKPLRVATSVDSRFIPDTLRDDLLLLMPHLTDLQVSCATLHAVDFSPLRSLKKLNLDVRPLFMDESRLLLPSSILGLASLETLVCGRAIHVTLEQVTRFATLHTLDVQGSLTGCLPVKFEYSHSQHGAATLHVPPGKLGWLRPLIVSDKHAATPSVTSIRQLRLRHGHVRPRSAQQMARHMTRLECLTIPAFDMDVRVSSAFERLIELDLDRCSPTTLAHLPVAAPALRRFFIRMSTAIRDFSALQACANLAHLHVRLVEKLHDQEALQFLEVAPVAGSGLAESIAKIASLESLDLGYCGRCNLDALSGLPKLVRLRRCALTDRASSADRFPIDDWPRTLPALTHLDTNFCIEEYYYHTSRADATCAFRARYPTLQHFS